jgi:hypothetical protein
MKIDAALHHDCETESNLLTSQPSRMIIGRSQQETT